MSGSIELTFQECDTCRAQPGAGPLCAGCLHNREVISLFWSAMRPGMISEAQAKVRAKIAQCESELRDLATMQEALDRRGK